MEYTDCRASEIHITTRYEAPVCLIINEFQAQSTRTAAAALEVAKLDASTVRMLKVTATPEFSILQGVSAVDSLIRTRRATQEQIDAYNTYNVELKTKNAIFAANEKLLRFVK